MYLILFDIDGTLVLTGRAGWRAMNRACADEVGHDNAMDGVEFAGRTDWSILERHHARSTARRWTPPLLDRAATGATSRTSPKRSSFPGTGVKDVMPGIRPLLDALQQRDDVALALLTGNFIDGARIKLEYFDLWKYFPCGAFGGDAAEPQRSRARSPCRRARECGVADVEPSRVHRRRRHAERRRVRAGRRRDPGRRRDRQLFGRGPARGRRRHRVQGSHGHARVPETCCDNQAFASELAKRTGPGGPPGLQNRLLRRVEREGWVRTQALPLNAGGNRF